MNMITAFARKFENVIRKTRITALFEAYVSKRAVKKIHTNSVCLNKKILKTKLSENKKQRNIFIDYARGT